MRVNRRKTIIKTDLKGLSSISKMEEEMAKFHGIVAFDDFEETTPGVWKPVVRRREYAGDIKRKNNRYVAGQQINDNLAINNQIEIIADPYINQHFPSIRYVEWNGNKWKVTSVEDQFPRLILALGEVYNGEQT